MRLEGWVSDDAARYVGLAVLLKLAWLEPESLELALEKHATHGTDVTLVRAGERATLSTELLAGDVGPLLAWALERVMPASDLARAVCASSSELARLDVLHGATDHVLSATSLDEVLDAYLSGVTGAFGLTRAAIFLCDEVRNEFLGFRMKTAETDNDFERAIRAMVLAPAQISSREAAFLAFEPVHPDESFLLDALVWREQVLGLLFADGRTGDDPLRAEEIRLLERLSAQVAVAWQSFRLQRKVEVQSRHDAPTGLANRRELDSRLSHERSRAQRMKMSLGFLLLGIDELDEADAERLKLSGPLLRNIGTVLKEELRAHDLAARFDDHHLAVILPGTGAFEAALVARRVGVAAHRKGISLSIGASAYPDDCDHPDDLIGLATRHLASAKAGGPGRAGLSDGGEAIVFAEEDAER